MRVSLSLKLENRWILDERCFYTVQGEKKISKLLEKS